MEVLTNLWLGSYEEACNPMFLDERRITHSVCCDTISNGHHRINELLEAGHKVIVYSLKKKAVQVILTYCMVYKNMSFMIAYYFLKPRVALEHPSAYTSASSFTAGDTGATAE